MTRPFQKLNPPKVGHGGARDGAGRPSLPSDKRLRRVVVYLSEAQIAAARALGSGGIGKGIRRLLDAVKKG